MVESVVTGAVIAKEVNDNDNDKDDDKDDGTVVADDDDADNADNADNIDATGGVGAASPSSSTDRGRKLFCNLIVISINPNFGEP